MNIRTRYLLGVGRFWHVTLLAGIFAISSPFLFDTEVDVFRANLAGGVFVFLGLILGSTYHGIQFAPERVRAYRAIFWIKIGEWQSAKPIRKILVTSENVSYWNMPNGVSPTFKTRVRQYTVGLLDENDAPLWFIQTENRTKAKAYSEQLAKMYGVSLTAEV